MRAVLRLFRIEYCLYGAAGVLYAAAVAGDLPLLRPEILIAVLAVLLAAIGSYALDDYYDLPEDRASGRNDRPLVTGELSPRFALGAGVAAFAAAAILATQIHLMAALVVYVSIPLTFLYNLKLKRVFLMKNLVIAGAFVAPLLVGALATDGTVEPIVAYGAVLMFVLGMGFEVMIDIPDLRGDRELGVATIPTRYGPRAAASVAAGFYLLVMIMDPLPFFVPIDDRFQGNTLFLALIIGPALSYLFFARSLLRVHSREAVRTLRRRLFVVWQVGTAAYLLGALL